MIEDILQFGQRAWQHLSAVSIATLVLLWATVLFAGVVTYIQTNPGRWSFRDFFRHLVPAGIFHHRSARADFLFWLSRRIFRSMAPGVSARTTSIAPESNWLVSRIM